MTPMVVVHHRGRAGTCIGGPDMDQTTRQQGRLDEHAVDQTVGRLLEDWLQSIEYAVRPRTLERYTQHVRRHAGPLIGHISLASLTSKDLQLAYAARARAGLSATSILHMHRALRQAFAQAVKWGLVEANVADRVNPP